MSTEIENIVRSTALEVEQNFRDRTGIWGPTKLVLSNEKETSHIWDANAWTLKIDATVKNGMVKMVSEGRNFQDERTIYLGLDEKEDQQ